MNKSTFEEEINKTGKLIYTSVGNSMMPIIHENCDILIIEKVSGRLKKYDIPLYKRASGQYVLHRILKIRKDSYVTCGDNHWKKEYDITDDNIIGVLTGIVRNGKKISVSDIKYKIYVHLWCDLFPIRAVILRIKYYITRRLK